jgi:phospholipid transport system substrate-binding protein
MRLMGRLGNGDRPSRRMTRRVVLQLTLVAVSLMPLPGGAADTTGASDAVTELNADLLAEMKAGRAVPFATRSAQLVPLIERVFDLPAILGASVELRWAELAQDDQTQLLDVFRGYTVSSCVANFDHAGGQSFVAPTDTWSVGGQVVVATQIVPLSGTPARIDYVLRPEKGEGGVLWKATDIMLDGSISQVAVQRSEFYGLLRNGGVANLIGTLRRKTADLPGGALSQPAGNATSGTPG